MLCHLNWESASIGIVSGCSWRAEASEQIYPLEPTCVGSNTMMELAGPAGFHINAGKTEKASVHYSPRKVLISKGNQSATAAGSTLASQPICMCFSHHAPLNLNRGLPRTPGASDPTTSWLARAPASSPTGTRTTYTKSPKRYQTSCPHSLRQVHRLHPLHMELKELRRRENRKGAESALCSYLPMWLGDSIY